MTRNGVIYLWEPVKHGTVSPEGGFYFRSSPRARYETTGCSDIRASIYGRLLRAAHVQVGELYTNREMSWKREEEGHGKRRSASLHEAPEILGRRKQHYGTHRTRLEVTKRETFL